MSEKDNAEKKKKYVDTLETWCFLLGFLFVAMLLITMLVSYQYQGITKTLDNQQECLEKYCTRSSDSFSQDDSVIRNELREYLKVCPSSCIQKKVLP